MDEVEFLPYPEKKKYLLSRCLCDPIQCNANCDDLGSQRGAEKQLHKSTDEATP